MFEFSVRTHGNCLAPRRLVAKRNVTDARSLQKAPTMRLEKKPASAVPGSAAKVLQTCISRNMIELKIATGAWHVAKHGRNRPQT